VSDIAVFQYSQSLCRSCAGNASTILRAGAGFEFGRSDFLRVWKQRFVALPDKGVAGWDNATLLIEHYGKSSASAVFLATGATSFNEH